MEQQTTTGAATVATVGPPKADAGVPAPSTIEVHNYPPSVLVDAEEVVVHAWGALPQPEKVLLKLTLRATIALAVARFLAVEAHNTLVTLAQEVLRDPGVQSALAAVLQGLVGN